MKRLLFLLCLLFLLKPAFGENRFGRPVVKVENAKEYLFTRSDDVNYPTLTSGHFVVSCLVYRGTQHYYVEITVANKTGEPVFVPLSFISFDKPGYTLYRTDTMTAAREAAALGGVSFRPIPPPYVPPSYNTTINATASTYGNQTNISETATTTPDYSGQAGANLGNAIGNAIAAHRFYKEQRVEVAFSNFLASHAQTDADTAIQAGQSRTIVATFDQAKQKKKPFVITLKVAAENFRFSFKE